jgi:tRNA (uracil-5-)-methyltransferase TRM9
VKRTNIKALLPALKLNSKPPYSRFFIYVWAYEQGSLSKRRMGVKATEGQDDLEGAGDGGGGEDKIQDVLVPWVLRSKSKPKPKSAPKSKFGPKSKSSPNVNEGEYTNREDDKVDEKDRSDSQDNGEEGTEEREQEEEEGEGEKVFNRYYHLFIEGELRDLIHKAGEEEGYRILPPISSSPSPLASSTSTSTSTTGTPQETESSTGTGRWLRIRGEGWEADNWWVEAEVGVGDGR